MSVKVLFAKLKMQFENLRRSVQPYLAYDYNHWLNLVMIGGGIDLPGDGTEPWKRNCWTVYRLLGFYQFFMALTKVAFSIYNQDDLVELFASIVVAVCFVINCIKVRILEHFCEDVGQLKDSVGIDIGHSGDPIYDASVRLDATKKARRAFFSLFVFLCCDQVITWIPNSARDRIVGVPKQCQALGSMVVHLLQESYVLTMIIFWGCRYFCCFFTVIPLLIKLRSELMIVVRGYATIEGRVQALILDDQYDAEGSSQMLPPSGILKWRHLKPTFEATLEQHVEVLRNIKLLQPIVSYVYAIDYYLVMGSVSFFLFLVIRSELSLVTLAMLSISCALVVECYFWCHIISSIEETMDKIVESVAELGCGLEHTLENHSEYIQMRTSLMIVQLNASQRELFSCGGFFPISVETFGDLCMIIYRFATFLLKFD